MGWNCCHCSAHNRGPSDNGVPCQNARLAPHCPHALCGKCARGVDDRMHRIERKHDRRSKKKSEKPKEGSGCIVM